MLDNPKGVDIFTSQLIVTLSFVINTMFRST